MAGLRLRALVAQLMDQPSAETLPRPTLFTETRGVPAVPGVEEGLSPQMLKPSTKGTQLNAAQERVFQNWYAGMATRYGLSREPGGQFYDYRGAYLAGAKPDRTAHWPSEFKQPGHPNEVVGGFNTITGKRQPGTTLATVQKLKDLGWNETFARENGSDKVKH